MHQVDPSVPVVVLGVHHGTLGIARSLGRLGIAVSCVDGDRSHPALASRYLRRVVAWDMKRAPEAATVAFLEELAHRLGGRPLLIPTTDAATIRCGCSTATSTRTPTVWSPSPARNCASTPCTSERPVLVSAYPTRRSQSSRPRS